MNTSHARYADGGTPAQLPPSRAPLEDSAGKPHGKTPWHIYAWRVMDTRVGLIPLPIYLLLLALLGGFIALGKLPTDISVSIAVLAVGGFTCAEFGKRMPLLRNIGAAAI
ncbi:MAG TPA: 2-hydroxycarboxylate transporter family protein, partial [Burkholderiaceae bacterium]|nr:2-hydroxycarboxylate transporter family protein [Burkholderiaceae bacterium]